MSKIKKDDKGTFWIKVVNINALFLCYTYIYFYVVI